MALALVFSFAATLVVASPALPAVEECLSDVQGADDEPGQKDLNQFCEAPGTGIFELHASWNFDDRQWSGANTGDSCGLFDTDGNGGANFALCVTVVGGPPAVMKAGSPKLYMCGNDRPDRCTNSVQDTNGFNSVCTVNSPAEAADPFVHSGSNPCKGTNCATIDTYIACSLDIDDVGVMPSCVNSHCSNAASQFCSENADCIPLTDVCSYPSEQPNSDPSDCIITATAQDPCKGVDCSNLDDGCNTGVCNVSSGECEQQAKADGTACGSSTNTTCNGADTCLAGVCQTNLTPIDTPCGNGADTVCDNPDSCDGNGNCRANHEATTVECRADAGACDVAEKCDVNGNCPADAHEPGGTPCGDSTDTICDDPDTCDANGICRPNYVSSTSVCREADGECDVAERCDGAGGCPANLFKALDTPCGSPSDSVCDNPDKCNGLGSCVNNHEPNTTVCREDAGECDVAEYCDGNGGCPGDGFEVQGNPCGNPSDTVCDNPDTCDASGVCQPRHESNQTVCREDAGDCDVAERCDGDGACPADAFETEGTPCGDRGNSVCDNPDSCDGNGACLENNEPTSVVCREYAGQCDLAEYCDDEGYCPSDTLKPNGTPCDDGEVCTGPDTCRSGECVGEPIQPTLTVIKEVIHDDEGHATADDFDLILDDGVTETHFRVEPDPTDSAIGSSTFELEHDTSYAVTENLGALGAYYKPTYYGDCTGTADCADPDRVCLIVNDDVYHKNQASIRFEWLTVGFPAEDDSRMHLEGGVEITDQSSNHESILVLLEGYALDWEYRTGGDTTWQPTDWDGPWGGSLQINGETFDYTCAYEIVDIDGVVGNPAGYHSGDPVVFDEKIHVDYACSFDKPLPVDGTLRGLATAQVFTKSGMIFHIRQGFDLVTGTMVTTTTSTITTSTSTTTTTLAENGGSAPIGGATTTTVPSSGGGGPGVPPGSCWDPNADGKASARDALQMLRAAVGLLVDGQTCRIEVCDQSCDGKVTVKDALIALKRAIGALQCFTGAVCPDGPTCCG